MPYYTWSVQVGHVFRDVFTALKVPNATITATYFVGRPGYWSFTGSTGENGCMEILSLLACVKPLGWIELNMIDVNVEGF
ncbi:hypothetical protein ACF0H5_006545 [Mactra antiquata]